MPTTPSIPRTIGEITPDWLTMMLRKHGCISRAAVAAITAQGIGAEVGFLDGVARLRLTYDQAEPTAPPSVVAKLPVADGIYRRIGNLYHAYEREICFYEEVAPHSPIRLPRCYCRAMDREADAYLLILEDLGSLTMGDQVKGLTPAQARACAETIGRFHASWWEAPKLKTFEWMPPSNMQPARYQSAWPKFRQIVGPHLSAAAVALGEKLGAHLEKLLRTIDEQPHTIVHTDFRADNLLLDDLSAAQPVVIVDWQLAVRSMGALDVARLMCGSMASPERAACETIALRGWHDALVAGGVRGYNFQQAFDDYRRGALLCLFYPVTIHEAEEAAGRRGTALAHAQIERFFTAALELDAAAMLPR